MFKGLRQKIGQGLSPSPKGPSTPHSVDQAPTSSSSSSANNTETPVRVQSSQISNSPDLLSDETPTITPSNSLINLNDDTSDTSMQQERVDSLIDLSSDFSGPAVLDISESGSNILDVRSPRDHGTRSRTSSVSSQASDSFFSPMSTLSSRQIPLPSDVESVTSEMEDGTTLPDSISKDEIYRSYCQMQQRSTRYRWKFSQVVKAYREIEKERDKLRDTMTKSQDKAFRRISELKEQIQLDQLAKVDLEQNYVLMLEEKEELIKVLRTQISLLKQGKDIPDDVIKSTEKSKAKKLGGVGAGDHNESVLKEKIARMSSLLMASKESISKNRDHIQKLNAENTQLQESLNAVTQEKEQLQAAAHKKDQDLEILLKKLRAENMKLVKETAQRTNDFNAITQIEDLHMNLLSEIASMQHLKRESEERLSAADAENQRLCSERTRLVDEVAELKCALEKYTHGDVASKLEVCAASLCSKHSLSSTAESGLNNKEASNMQGVSSCQASSECGATARVVEHGAGEFTVQESLTCIVCEKEQLLLDANEKLQSCRETIHSLEESTARMQVQLDERNTLPPVAQVEKLCSGSDAVEDMVPEETRNRDNVMLEGNNYGEIKCLNSRIEWLENQLSEADAARWSLLEDAKARHETELDDLRQKLKTTTVEITGNLSEELELLKEQVVCRETELTRQIELSAMAEKTVEMLENKLDVQRQSYEMKMSLLTEENQKLTGQLKAVEERHSTISTALKEVTSLKASLSASVHAVVQETVQEAFSEVESQAKDLPKASLVYDGDVAMGHQEDVKISDELDDTTDSSIQNPSENVDKLLCTDSGEVNVDSDNQVEELRSKNDSLHRLLHEWQGCIQVLKTCLEEKQKQNDALSNNLEQKQKENEMLDGQYKNVLHSLDKLRQEQEELENELEKLRNDLESSNFESEKLQTHLDSSEREVERLQGCLKSLEGERETLQNRLDSSKEQLEKLQNDLKVTEAESLRLQSVQADLEPLGEENKKISQQLCAAEAQIEELLSTMHDLKKLKDSEETTLKKSLHDAVDMAQKELENKIYQIKEEKDALELQFQKLQQQSENSIENLRSNNEKVVLEYEQMRSQEDNLRRRMTELVQTNDELKKQQDFHENEIGLLQKQLDILKQKNDEVWQLEKSASEELLRTKERCRAAEDAIAESCSKETVLQKRVEELCDEKMLSDKRCADHMDRISDLENELTVLKDQGNSSRNKMQKAIKLLKDQNDSFSLQVRESGEQMENCQKLQQELESKNELLVLQVKSMEETRDTLQKEVQDQREHIDSLVFQIKNFETEKGDLHRDVQDLQSQKEALCHQAKELESHTGGLQQELQELKEKYEAVCCDVKMLEEARDVMQEKEQNISSHSESLCIEVRALEERLECIVKELNDLELKNKYLQSSLEDAEATKQSMVEEMTENENRLLEEANTLRVQILEISAQNRSLESQLQGLETAKFECDQKLELSFSETLKLNEMIHCKDDEQNQFREMVKTLTEQSDKKDLEITALKENLQEVNLQCKAELFSLRTQLCKILDVEVQCLVESDSSHANELAALQRVVESELSFHVSKLKSEIEEHKLRIHESEKKILELTRQIEIAEMNLNEEELQWKRKQGVIEIENEELHHKAASLQVLTKELQDRFDESGKILSEKDQLLFEVRNKLRTLCGESVEDTARLPEAIERIEDKISNISRKCIENERVACELKSLNESANSKISELTEALGNSEERLRKTEANMECMSGEHIAERTRLAAKIQELADEILVLQEKKLDADNTVEGNREILKSLQEKLRNSVEGHETEMKHLKLEFDRKLQMKTEESETLKNSLNDYNLLIDRLQNDLKMVEDTGNTELQNFRAKVKDLENALTLAEQNAHHDILKTKEALNSEWNEILSRDREKHDLEVAQLKDTLSSHKDHNEVLAKSLSELEAVKNALEEETMLLKNTNTELISRTDASQKDLLKQLDVSLAECQAKDTKVNDLSKIIDNTKLEVAALEERLASKTEEIENLQLTIGNFKEKIQMNFSNEEMIQEKQNLIQKLEEKMKVEKETNEGLISVMKTENEHLKQEIQKLQNEIDELKNATDRLNVSVDEKINEIETLNNSTAHFQQECSKLLSEKIALIEEKEILTRDFEAKLIASCESQNEKDEQYSTDVAAMEIRFQDKAKELQRKFVTKLKAVQSENEKVVKEIRRENEELLTRNADLEKQWNDFRKLSEQQQIIIDELTKELRRLEENREEELKKHHEELVETCQKEMCNEELQKSSHASENEINVSNASHIALKEVENELSMAKVQLEKALAGESAACLKLEKAEKMIAELNRNLAELSRNMEEMKLKSQEELRSQAERLESECADKLAELKKKAEMRLKQIKSQVRMEKDSSITEIILARNDLEAELSAQKEELDLSLKNLREKEDEIARLNVELESARDKWSRDTSSLRTESEDSARKLEEELSSKNGYIEDLQVKCQQLNEETAELKQTVQSLRAEGSTQAEKFSELETKFKSLKRQLVSAKHEIDRLKSDRDVDVRTAQLENEKEMAKLASEYKEQLKDFEIDNNSRIKQLVKEFQLKLSEKEKEFQTTYTEALEKSQREEDLMAHQQKQDLKSLRQEMREKEEAYEERIEQLEVQLQAAEMHLEEEINKSRDEIEGFKLNIEQLETQLASHRDALKVQNNTAEDSDHQTVEETIGLTRVKPLGAPLAGTSFCMNAMLEQQVVELTRQIEDLKIRYSLQVIKDQADANCEPLLSHEAKPDSSLTSNERQTEVQILELHNMDLQAQVIQQCGDIARLKIQEKALQQEIQMLNNRNGQMPESQPPIDDLSSVVQSTTVQTTGTELQYLRNVLLKFMTGVEQQTLARVICMVLKFSEEETQLVMEHQSEFFD